MASFKLKFKFLGTIELNFGFFQLKALNIYPSPGQFRFKPGPLLSTFFKSRPWMSWSLQLFSSQGLESLNPSTFFNPRKPWKNPKLIDNWCTYLADEKQMGEKLYICKAKSMPPTKSSGAIWPFCIAHVSNWHINFAKYIF